MSSKMANTTEENTLVKKETFKAKLKEWARKRMVSLKRNPSQIPLLVIAITMILSTFNMSYYTATIRYVGRSPMGLMFFIITLFAFLSTLSYVQAYPKRAKKKTIYIVATFVMLILTIPCELVYIITSNGFITDTLNNPMVDGAAVIAEKCPHIYDTIIISYAHIALCAVSVVLMALVPVFKFLFAKVNTSVDNGDDADVEAIDIADDEE